MIVQFSGETREQSVVNHFSLDLEDEEQFFDYIELMGYTIDSPDEELESLHKMWFKQKYGKEI